MKHRISQLEGNIDFGEEDSESINVVAMTYMISAKERKTLKEVTKDLEKTEVWDNIELSHFNVKEELGNFIVEVDCVRMDNPEDFTVAWAVSLLKSLSWPQGHSVISSLTSSNPREGRRGKNLLIFGHYEEKKEEKNTFSGKIKSAS